MHDLNGNRPHRWLVLVITMLFTAVLVILLMFQTNVISAQNATPLPTITNTASPETPIPTLIPTLTPTAIPTTVAPFAGRLPITSENAKHLQKYREWQAHYAMSNGVVFVPNTSHLISIGYEGGLDNASPIRLWDIQEDGIRQIDHFFEGVPPTVMGGIDQLGLSPDGARVIAAFKGTSVWDSTTGKLIGRANQLGQTGSILDASNQVLFISSITQFVGEWIIPAGIPATDENAPPLPDDYVFDPMGALVRTFQVDEAISQIAFSNETQPLFVLTQTGRLLIYKSVNDIDYTVTEVPPASVVDESSPFRQALTHKLILNAANHQLIYMDQNWDVAVYDFVQDKLINRYPWGKPVSCFVSSPDEKLLVFPDWDYQMTLHIMDTATGKLIAQIPTGQNILSCAFSWDSKFIATADINGRIVLWGVPAT